MVQVAGMLQPRLSLKQRHLLVTRLLVVPLLLRLCCQMTSCQHLQPTLILHQALQQLQLQLLPLTLLLLRQMQTGTTRMTVMAKGTQGSGRWWAVNSPRRYSQVAIQRGPGVVLLLL
jgi:hypothetical protein